MSRPDAAIDDLVALARRGDLSEHDERKLREQLAVDDDSNELYEAGKAFDLEDEVKLDDGARVDAIVRKVDQRLREGAVPRRKWIARVALGAAMLGGAAVGAVELATRPAAPASSPASVASGDEGSARRHGVMRSGERGWPTTEAIEPEPLLAPPPPVIVPPPAPPPPDEVPAPPPPVHVVHSAPARVAAPPPPPPPVEVAPPPPPPVEAPPPPAPTAGEMFTQANQARVRGDTAAAIRLSNELVAHYPESREALAAHLSLGLLYLQSGKAALALDEFHRYRTSSTGAMVAEALWGESQALAALHRAGDERVVLQELLAKYPQSAYAAAAKKRLDALP